MGLRFNFGPGGIGFDLGPGGFGPRRPLPPRGLGDFDDWGGGNWGGGGRGRRRRRQVDASELRLVLLHMIAAEPRHGYDLIRQFEELSGGAYVPSPGTVYPMLTMLGDMGHIEEVPGEGSRKVFRATDEGRAWLAERTDEAAALLERLSDLGAGSRRAGGAPIGRAVSNLLASLWGRVTRDDMNEATLHDIAEVLDDAARRIERLKRSGEA
ncbi:MAG TPA: PadR family transcriptional regulator [Allosphingosinicella sp.]|jgi:DNA-binding PadR family transcriptional regulator